MAILWLICATAAFSTLTAMGLAIPHAIFDNEHRLTPHRIIKTATGKSSFDKVVVGAVTACAKAVFGFMKSVVLCQFSSATSSEYALVPLDTQLATASSPVEGAATTAAATGKNQESVGLITDGKVTFNLELNVPTDYLGVGVPVTNKDPPMFEVKRLNVLSGEESLFSSEGIDFTLRR